MASIAHLSLTIEGENDAYQWVPILLCDSVIKIELFSTTADSPAVIEDELSSTTTYLWFQQRNSVEAKLSSGVASERRVRRPLTWSLLSNKGMIDERIGKEYYEGCSGMMFMDDDKVVKKKSGITLDDGTDEGGAGFGRNVEVPMRQKSIRKPLSYLDDFIR
ncbi:hypothetical protein NDU88_010582 [Pleurodeles waltl]|uniref:Uncharacterized protein n=1 Tax=Pleurodeles waltl TaxID=8319 RepID=A0AAV7S2B6_PLEWA|nr:hypothetical protein NDU88_010582 [Pleurodeles waltl]